MDLDHGRCWGTSKKDSWKTTLLLAYQSLGVVYGDLSIFPLYVYKGTFAEDIHHSETNEEIFGVLSFVFWTLTLVPLFKYVFIVLRADDNGEGGTFALYSLIYRHAKFSLLPNRQVADEALSTYKFEHPPEPKNNSSKVKLVFEKHKSLLTALLILVLLGTCMVIGDGLLTPAISVFSAVSGLELSMSKDQHQYGTKNIPTKAEKNVIRILTKAQVDAELEQTKSMTAQEAAAQAVAEAEPLQCKTLGSILHPDQIADEQLLVFLTRSWPGSYSIICADSHHHSLHLWILAVQCLSFANI
ncbi:unnamed protein product [Fraxinus pennsylvanica]|uniref:K+ potassium transporter integral membrane domain-containing protein n=1 Tax=Fraxinus pennsylvanica TaxID=56036 RepID=A0AAD1ZPA7_9LAMI|nr:unnamed protein product [Fraxinus pennsylvanica]